MAIGSIGGVTPAPVCRTAPRLCTNQTNRVRQQVARFGRSRATWRQRQRVGAGGCVTWRQRPPEAAANRWALFRFVHPGAVVPPFAQATFVAAIRDKPCLGLLPTPAHGIASAVRTHPLARRREAGGGTMGLLTATAGVSTLPRLLLLLLLHVSYAFELSATGASAQHGAAAGGPCGLGQLHEPCLSRLTGAPTPRPLAAPPVRPEGSHSGRPDGAWLTENARCGRVGCCPAVWASSCLTRKARARHACTPPCV